MIDMNKDKIKKILFEIGIIITLILMGLK